MRARSTCSSQLLASSCFASVDWSLLSANDMMLPICSNLRSSLFAGVFCLCSVRLNGEFCMVFSC